MERDSRQRKLQRYKKYDPHAAHLDRKYYDMLKSDTAQPFDFEALSKQIADEVATYNQSKPKQTMKKKKERYGYVKTPHGMTVDIPEKHIERTLKRPGFEWIGWADEDQEEIEEMFEDTKLDTNASANTPAFGLAPNQQTEDPFHPKPDPNAKRPKEKVDAPKKKTAKKAAKK